MSLIWSKHLAIASFYIFITAIQYSTFRLPVIFAYGDIYLSLSDITNVENVRFNITDILANYIKAENQRLDRLREIHKQSMAVDTELRNERTHLSSNLLHPLNSFSLIKNLTRLTDEVYELIDERPSKNNVDAIEKLSMLTDLKLLPTETDYQGAGRALIRVQKFYNLDMDALVGGQLVSKVNMTFLDNASHFLEKGANLTDNDCYEIGRLAYNDEDYDAAIIWFEQALKLMNFDLEEDQNVTLQTTNNTLILSYLEYLAWSAYLNNRTDYAYQVTKKWLTLDPDNDRAQNNIVHYEDMMSNGGKQLPVDSDNSTINNWLKTSDISSNQSEAHTARLCRGEQPVLRPLSKLMCRLHVPSVYDTGYKFLSYRVEVLNSGPEIIMVYDFITNKEAAHIVSISRDHLLPSTVETKQGTKPSPWHRVAKTAWLEDSRYEVVSRLQQRITRFSGLYVNGSEDLQVVNYGMGGFYNSHLDHLRKQYSTDIVASDDKNIHHNDRMATFLMYLTDVPAGGATTFTEIGLTVYPVKKSALLWYNIRRNGYGDSRVRHCACPVLYGDKWIATQWLREQANVFIRPCALELDS